MACDDNISTSALSCQDNSNILFDNVNILFSSAPGTQPQIGAPLATVILPLGFVLSPLERIPGLFVLFMLVWLLVIIPMLTFNSPFTKYGGSDPMGCTPVCVSRRV